MTRVGELAMSALIIQPAAVGRRHLFRNNGIRIARLIPAAMLSLHASVAAAVEAPAKPSLDRNSLYLSSAGFRIQVANDPAGQRAMRALPAHRFVTEGVGDTMRYYYAEPQRCICVFVGTQQAYDRYRQMVNLPLTSTTSSPNYKTQAGVLLSGQPMRQSTKGDPTNLSDYLHTLGSSY
jgi:hypothetical protein